MKSLALVLVIGCVSLAACTALPTPGSTSVAPTREPATAPAATPAPASSAVVQPTVAGVLEATPPPPIPGAVFVGRRVTPLGFVETFHMDAWFVPGPNPPLGTKTTLSVSLIKNSVQWLGGDLQAEWWKGDEQQICRVIVIYHRGICDITTDGYERGVFVPITATIKYLDQAYTMHTGFTPQ